MPLHAERALTNEVCNGLVLLPQDAPQLVYAAFGLHALSA